MFTSLVHRLSVLLFAFLILASAFVTFGGVAQAAQFSYSCGQVISHGGNDLSHLAVNEISVDNSNDWQHLGVIRRGGSYRLIAYVSNVGFPAEAQNTYDLYGPSLIVQNYQTIPNFQTNNGAKGFIVDFSVSANAPTGSYTYYFETYLKRNGTYAYENVNICVS